MKRSIPIVAALLCAAGAPSAHADGNALNGGRFGGDTSALLGPRGNPYDDARRAAEIAQRRLREAERSHVEARGRLDELIARHGAARRDLAVVERKLAECNTANVYEVRRLERELDAAAGQARAIEADLARLRNQAAAANRAADAAKAEYFRQAECSPTMADAKERVRFAEAELESARRHAVARLHDSREWRETAWQRDEAKRRLDQALWHGVRGHEADRLRRDLDAAECRLRDLEKDAAAYDPIVRDAEHRLAVSQRAHTDAWACVERDLARDPDYCAALAAARRFEQDAADAEGAFADARTYIAHLERELDRLRGSNFVIDSSSLEREAITLRAAVDRLAHDARNADECVRRTEYEVQTARAAYAAARAALDYCRPEPPPRHDPRHDPRGGHGADPKHRGDRDNDDDEHRGSYRDRGDRYERAKGGDDRKRTRD